MAKSLSVDEQLMKNYLSQLLTDEEVSSATALPQKTTALSIENLLIPQELPPVNKKKKSCEESQINVKEQAKVLSDYRKQEDKLAVKKAAKKYRKGDFQAIFFDVAGLTIAVPLIELGGIYNIKKITPMLSKPQWLKGVMSIPNKQINIVDTAQWIMPEKCNKHLLEKLDYKYTIKLGDSDWGLTVEKLIKTETLSQDDIKWLAPSSQRPWLAGLVKKRMCVLLEVESLIEILQQGEGVIVSN